jgi:hypothetical protein
MIGYFLKSHAPITPKTLCLVQAMKLLGFMLRNRCWSITFHTIITGDADGWCLNLTV